MMRTMLGSEIHRATVTRADLHHVGSVTVDEDLLISYGQVDDVGSSSWLPTVVHVDAADRVVAIGIDPATPPPGGAGDGLVRGDVVQGDTVRP